MPGNGLAVHETMELTTRYKTLAKTPIFNVLSDPLRRKLAREVVPECIPAGSTVPPFVVVLLGATRCVAQRG